MTARDRTGSRPAARPPGGVERMRTGFRRLLEEKSRATPFAGARIYVSRHGECLLNTAVGEARPGRAMSLDSVLYWSCAAKPLLATVVMSLVDDGEVELTDRVHRHLPGFEVGGKHEITVDDLLSHAGGFRWFDGPGPYLESYQRFLCRAMAAEREPGWQPGLHQGYHQETAWYVLAALVEAKLEIPYPQAVSERVCAPLGMRSTWVSMAQPTYHQVRHDLAVPSYTRNGAARRVPFLTTAAAARTRCPPYDGYGTVDDLARFYEACLGALGADQPFPLSAPTLRLMVSSPRGWAYDHTWDRACEYGRGFFRNLSGAWGFGQRWSPSSFGIAGLVGHLVAGADPDTGVVIAAAFGALAAGRDELADLTDTLYDLAMSHPPDRSGIEKRGAPSRS